MNIAFIQWTSPWWAMGLLAIAAPIAAHLLSRRASRLAVFPSIRFIQEAVAQRRRKTQPRNLFLLAMRCLVVALLVAAFTQPVWYSVRPTSAGSGLRIVLVLDRSASMNRTEQGVSLFDHARRRLIQRLNQLDPSRDRATVVLVDAAPRLVLPNPTGNFTQLAGLLESIKPSYERGDMNAALLLASFAAIDDSSDSPAAGRFPSVRRAGQIEVFSDMQATGWPSKFGLDDVSLVSHPIGKPAGNLAVYNARIEPARPIVGQTATLSVEVAYFDESSALPQSIPLRIEIPGYKPTTRLLRLEGGQTATVSLVFRAIEPGPLYVRFELGDASGDSLGDGPTDALKEDNATGLYVQVRRSRRVGLVTGVGADNPQTASYYLARGLAPDTYGVPLSSAAAPIPDDSGKSKEPANQVGGVDLTVLSPDQLARKADPDISIFVVVEAESLSGDALVRLYGYLKAGAGVIWVIDSPKALEALRQFDRLDPKQSLIPITPDAQGYWVTQADARFGSGRFESPILSVFDGPARSGLLGQRFSTVMRGKLAPMASALLRFEDGRPAMAGQWIGPGRLVVFAAPLTPSESPIIKQAPFVPLIHQLVRKLTPGPPAQPNPHPADQPSVVLPGSLSARQVRAYTIDKRSISVDIKVQDDRTVVQFDRIEKPGRYELRDSTKDQTLGGVHVEIDPRESDLRVAVGPGGKVDFAPGVGRSGSGSAFGTGVVGADVKLWPWLALTALVLALLEHIIATMGTTTKPLLSSGPFGAISRTNKVETS